MQPTLSPRLEEITAGLHALKAEDFDYSNPAADGDKRLEELTDALLELPHPERAVSALFNVMERMPEADLGTPGPLVYTLERMKGTYEEELARSIQRIPAPLSVWMVNRILNKTKDAAQREPWLGLLRIAAEHPASTYNVREDAKHFLLMQNRDKITSQ